MIPSETFTAVAHLVENRRKYADRDSIAAEVRARWCPTLTPEECSRLVDHAMGRYTDPAAHDVAGDRYAGSDIDAMLDAVDEPHLFDVSGLGGRHCETCGHSIDDARSDAHHCSDACRARGWRKGQKVQP